MNCTTYTMLVTINHEGTAPRAADVIDQIVQGLEEGTRSHPTSVVAACADAAVGDWVRTDAPKPLGTAKPFHKDLRDCPP